MLADRVKRDVPLSDATARDAERGKLRQVVRCQPAKLDRVWTTGITKHGGIETKSHLLAMNDGLMTNAVWLRPIGAPDSAPATIVLDDKGKGATSEPVAERLSRGEQVLAADLTFQGDEWKQGSNWLFEQMIVTTGARPLGIEAAHLIELANWMKRRGAPRVRLETSGMRNQVVALVAAALQPRLFSEVMVRHGIRSLRHLVDNPVKYQDAADLFCLDLYKFTDLDGLAVLGAPTAVKGVNAD